MNPAAIQRAMTTFCMLPPLSRLTSAAARVSICSFRTAMSTRRLSSPIANGPPAAQSAERGQRHVLLHRALRQERHQPVGRDQHEAGADRVGGMPQLEHAPFRPHLSGVGSPHAGDAIEQFLLSLPFQSGDSEHFAAIDPEGDAMQRVAVAQAVHFERRGLTRRLGTGGARDRRSLSPWPRPSPASG